MKLVIQRVTEATVTVNTKAICHIEKGLFVLIGIKTGDTQKKVDDMAEKLSKLRIMEDKSGKMNLSVKDAGGAFLIVSQFTLYADTKGGNRPSFLEAAKPDVAVSLYNAFVTKLKEYGFTVQTGEFGKEMKIDAKLDGPVTILMES